MKKILSLLFFIFLIPVFANAADVYVNNTGSCSDSYTRAQAMSPSTSWCTLENAFNKVQDNDVIIGDGTYRDENYLDIDNHHFNGTVTLKGSVYPEWNRTYDYNTNTTNVTLVRNGSLVISGFLNGVTFTNISNSTEPNFYRSGTVSTGSTTVGCLANASTINPTLLYAYDSLANMNNDKGRPIGTFFNGSNIFLRYTPGRNPANDDIQCYKGGAVSLSNTWNVTLEGIMFRGGYKVIFIDTSSDQITIKNSTISGGASRALLDIDNASRILVDGNYMAMTFPENFTWCSVKGCEEDYQDFNFEIGASWCEETYNCTYTNNIVNGYFNGFMCINGPTVTNPNYLCYTGYNEFYNIWDDAMEDESITPSMTMEYNFCHDSFVCASVAPGNCISGDYTCNIRYNRMHCEKYTPRNRTTNMSPYCFKYQNQSNVGMIGWNITHNTVKSDSICWSEILATGGTVSSLFNWSTTDNIFICAATILVRSGKASNRVFFDYNTYNRTTAGRYFNLWNNDTGDLNSLALALASPYWDGTWDIHSLDIQPQLDGDDVPPYDSPVCGAASDGGDIGAVACEAPPAPSCSNGSITNKVICNSAGCTYISGNCTLSFTISSKLLTCTFGGCV